MDPNAKAISVMVDISMQQYTVPYGCSLRPIGWHKWVRTTDLTIIGRLLYQLSYAPICAAGAHAVHCAMPMILQRDDPVFARFREQRFRSDLLLVCPHGAGTQFLLGQLTGRCELDSEYNNCVSHGARWLAMENSYLGCEPNGDLRVDTADLAAQAIGWTRRIATRDHTTIDAAPQLPLLSWLLFDYGTQQLLNITVDPVYDWYLAILSWYKYFCRPIVDGNQVATLLSQTRRLDQRLIPNDYHSMLNRLQNNQVIAHANSVATWLYFVDSVMDGLDPGDPAVWRAWLLRAIKSHISHTPPTVAAADIAAIHSSCAAVINCDWFDISLDLNLPSCLALVDLVQLAEYSRRDLDIVSRICSFLPLDFARVWRILLADMRGRLRVAQRRIGGSSIYASSSGMV